MTGPLPPAPSGEPPPTPREVAPDVYCLGPKGRSQTNVYFVRSGSSWILVDAGWGRDAPRILGAAASLFGDSPPAAILLTHAHPDHAGSARALATAWSVPVYLHPSEVALATGDFAAMRTFAGPLDRWLILPLMAAMGRRRREAVLARSSLGDVVRTLEPEGSIAALPDWHWVHTPGHTPGHVSFLRTADRVLLTGDALLTLQVNTPAGMLLGRSGMSGPPRYTTWSWRRSIESIATIARLEPRIVGAGHGRPLRGPETPDVVRTFAARLAARAREDRPADLDRVR